MKNEKQLRWNRTRSSDPQRLDLSQSLWIVGGIFTLYKHPQRSLATKCIDIVTSWLYTKAFLIQHLLYKSQDTSSWGGVHG